MRRNILLTTMSTIQFRSSINYYFDEEADSFFTGVASIEPGAKYFLSRRKLGIDRIIVLGSEQTYHKDDVLSCHDLSQEYQQLRNAPVDKMSDFTFFKYRIGQFLTGDGLEENKVGESIEETRREEIRRIVEDTLKANGLNDSRTWFADINRDNAEKHYDRAIRTALKEDIEKNFVKPEDYDRYVDPSTFPEVEEVRNEQKLVQSLDQQLDEIDKKIRDAKGNSIRDESFLSSALQHLEDARTEIQEKKLDSNEAVNAEVMSRLSRTIQNLISEIRSLKEKRLDQENIYAKQYIFSCLEDARKGSFPKTGNPISVQFIPERTDQGTDNIVGIINGILGDSAEKIGLYIDMQGGGRTDGYVRNAILSVLNNESSQNVEICSVVASNFERRNFANTIVDETDRYKITDLVSGMNAFIRYGKADLIQEYVKETGITNKRVTDLVNEMVKVDHALSICDINRFTDSIQRLKKLFTSEDEEAAPGTEVFEALEDGIRKDYARLLRGDEINYIDLAQWALDKNFIQQALTILESKMPEEFVRRGILYYCSKSDDKNEIIKKLVKIRNGMNKKDRYVLNNVDHYFIKNYQKALDNKDFGGDVPIENQTDFNEDEVNRIYNSYDKICNIRNSLNHANISARDLANKMGRDIPKNCDLSQWMYDSLKEEAQNFINDYKSVVGNRPYSENVVRITVADLNRAGRPDGTAGQKRQDVKKPAIKAETKPAALKLDPVDLNAPIEALCIVPATSSQECRNILRNIGDGYQHKLSNIKITNNKQKYSGLITIVSTAPTETFKKANEKNVVALAKAEINSFLKNGDNRLIFIDSRIMNYCEGELKTLTGVSCRLIPVVWENKKYNVQSA